MIGGLLLGLGVLAALWGYRSIGFGKRPRLTVDQWKDVWRR